MPHHGAWLRQETGLPGHVLIPVTTGKGKRRAPNTGNSVVAEAELVVPGVAASEGKDCESWEDEGERAGVRVAAAPSLPNLWRIKAISSSWLIENPAGQEYPEGMDWTQGGKRCGT